MYFPPPTSEQILCRGDRRTSAIQILAKYDPSTNLNVDAQREVKMAAFGILLRCVGGEKTKKLAVNERKKEKKAERAAEEVETDSETTCQVLPTLQPEEKN